MTEKLMKRNRRVRRAQRKLQAQYGAGITLFTACAFIGRAILRRAE